MGKIYALYNPLAGNGTCEDKCRKLNEIFEEEILYRDFTQLDIGHFFKELSEDDKVIICGGDGTLNYLINSIDTDNLKNEILFYTAGSGNDFYNDVKKDNQDEVIVINRYLKDLPYVELNGIKKKFIDGIGYGIDGYCCEEGDRQRLLNPGKPINYPKIAIKGLLYAFHRVNAKITIDGKTEDYKDVWMAPSMNGRFYGGGMMCAPNQDRLNRNNQVSVIIIHSRSRIRLLMAFLSIFKGEHLKYKKIVTERKGSTVNVKFDRPTALQIDGDTYSNITEYSVYIKDKR